MKDSILGARGLAMLKTGAMYGREDVECGSMPREFI